MNQRDDILLESGTNELEILEFTIGRNKFAINVIKVREILNPIPVTQLPHSHPHVQGIIELRGEVLPVIDMAIALGFPRSENPELDKYIVAEFNQQKVIYRVHNVAQIHRVSWEQIEKANSMAQGQISQVIGVIQNKGETILLIDFEKIMVDINPEAGIHINQMKGLGKRDRSDKKLVVAEDSPLLRSLIQDTLEEAGYVHVEYFENGKEALAYLRSVIDGGKNIEDEIQLVITDIEMPQMDGHYFTRQVKSNQDLAILPVIIFSSLITEDLKYKGNMVGADAQVSKPEIAKLIRHIDQYIL